MLTISFSGHRPEKIGGFNLNSPLNKEIEDKLYDIICTLLNHTKEQDILFISGGALGVDQIAFYVVQERIKPKYRNLNIINELAIPFEQQYIKWSDNDKTRHFIHKQIADKITYVDTLDEYKTKGIQPGLFNYKKFQKRNEYMVDKSDIMIFVFRSNIEEKGGTYNCLKYSNKVKKKVILYDPIIKTTILLNKN